MNAKEIMHRNEKRRRYEALENELKDLKLKFQKVVKSKHQVTEQKEGMQKS